MNQSCVVVAAGSKARFFTLQDVTYPEMESGPNLKEVSDLINPENDILDRNLYSESKSGRNRASNGSGAHGYDDHRAQHGDEFERRFARSVAEETAKLAKTQKAQDVVLVAQKRMLGFMRNALGPLLKTGIKVQELAKDLTKLPPLELHEHLAREHLIPERRGPHS